MKQSKKNIRGLSLIEVLLSITILGIGAAVLLTATARCLAVASKAKHYSTAQRLISRVEAEHPLSRGMIEQRSDSGTFDGDPMYRWTREIAESEDENRAGLFTVRTRVLWSDRGQETFEEAVTWIYIPPEEPL